MSIFNAIRNSYRSLVGEMSVEKERKYRDWSGYNGKVTKASGDENLKVNVELQKRIYQNDYKKLKIVEEKAKDDELTIESYGFKKTLADYVKSYYWDVNIENQKKICINLYTLYKEIYQDSKGNEVLELKNALYKLTQKANVDRVLEESKKRRYDYRQSQLEKLARAA